MLGLISDQYQIPCWVCKTPYFWVQRADPTTLGTQVERCALKRSGLLNMSTHNLGFVERRTFSREMEGLLRQNVCYDCAVAQDCQCPSVQNLRGMHTQGYIERTHDSTATLLWEGASKLTSRLRIQMSITDNSQPTENNICCCLYLSTSTPMAQL